MPNISSIINEPYKYNQSIKKLLTSFDVNIMDDLFLIKFFVRYTFINIFIAFNAKTVELRHVSLNGWRFNN